jgi:flagellar motor switch protein FliG
MREPHQGVRKAAVLIASLDPESANALLSQMPVEQAEAVRVEARSLGPVDPEEQQDVIDEFFRVGPLVPQKQPQGIELSGTLPPEWSRPAPDEGELSCAPPHTATRPLTSLGDAPPRLLSTFLEREHPQTIAVVLAHLPSERAAEVLAALDSDLQIEVARRLVDLDDTDAQVLDDVETALAAWLEDQMRGDRRREAGLSALNNILGAATPRAKQHLLANLTRHDRQLAGRINVAPQRPVRFSDVERLDAASLAVVLQHADADIMALALAGARPEFAERALRLIPADEAKSLRRSMLELGPIRLSDVEDAQRQLAALTGQLQVRGDIACGERDHLSVAV